MIVCCKRCPRAVVIAAALPAGPPTPTMQQCATNNSNPGARGRVLDANAAHLLSSSSLLLSALRFLAAAAGLASSSEDSSCEPGSGALFFRLNVVVLCFYETRREEGGCRVRGKGIAGDSTSVCFSTPTGRNLRGKKGELGVKRTSEESSSLLSSSSLDSAFLAAGLAAGLAAALAAGLAAGFSSSEESSDESLSSESESESEAGAGAFLAEPLAALAAGLAAGFSSSEESSDELESCGEWRVGRLVSYCEIVLLRGGGRKQGTGKVYEAVTSTRGEQHSWRPAEHLGAQDAWR